jgi:hypothetical protein
MSIFPELDDLNLEQLIERFEGVPPEGVDESFFFEEVAVKIREQGEPGLDYLIQHYDGSDPDRKQGILLGIVYFDTDDRRVKEIVLGALHEQDPFILQAAIDGLTILRDAGALDHVLPFLHHPVPYVRGKVVRYMSRLHVEKAIPILINFATDPDYIVRASDCR